jgi:hypothetical protein
MWVKICATVKPSCLQDHEIGTVKRSYRQEFVRSRVLILWGKNMRTYIYVQIFQVLFETKSSQGIYITTFEAQW